MKLTQKVNHFAVFKSSPSTIVATHRSPCQITWKKLAGWTCEVVSGMFSLGGWQGMDWRKKVTAQNCGRSPVKLKNQPGGIVLAP